MPQVLCAQSFVRWPFQCGMEFAPLYIKDLYLVIALSKKNMVKAEVLRQEIIRKEFGYACTIHGLDGNIPGLLSHTSDSMIKEAARILPKIAPENYTFSEVIEHALENFRRVLEDQCEPQPIYKKFPVRDYTIETDEGTINTLYLAFYGILTHSAYNELENKQHNTLTQYMYLKTLARLLHIDERTVYKNYDPQNNTLFIEYETQKIRNHKVIITDDAKEKLFKKLDTIILLNEIEEYFKNTFDKKYNVAASQKVYPFFNNPLKYISPGEALFFPFERIHLFGERMFEAIDLRALNAFMRIIYRDERILTSHFNLKKASQLTGLNRRTLNDYIKEGSLGARKIIFLPENHTGGGYRLCHHDLIAFKRKRTTIGADRLTDGSEKSKKIYNLFPPYFSPKSAEDVLLHLYKQGKELIFFEEYRFYISHFFPHIKDSEIYNLMADSERIRQKAHTLAIKEFIEKNRGLKSCLPPDYVTDNKKEFISKVITSSHDTLSFYAFHTLVNRHYYSSLLDGSVEHLFFVYKTSHYLWTIGFKDINLRQARKIYNKLNPSTGSSRNSPHIKKSTSPLYKKNSKDKFKHRSIVDMFLLFDTTTIKKLVHNISKIKEENREYKIKSIIDFIDNLRNTNIL
ncbi:MAG: hypothetical protein ACMUJM_14250 [bacterium]